MERERIENLEPDYLVLAVKIGAETREVKFFYLDGLTTERAEEYDAYVEDEKKAADTTRASIFRLNAKCLHWLSENISLEEIEKHLTQRTINMLFSKLTAQYDEKKSADSGA